jgi:hypothetical protein
MNTATAITIAALAALTPTVTCMIGIILQRQDTRDLRGEMRDLRSDVRSEMVALRNLVHADMLLIHERVAKVEGGRTGT